MKTQFVFLVVCVIAAFALPEGRIDVGDNNSDEVEVAQHNNQEIEILDDNQGTANTSDESIENLDEKLVASDETTTEKNRSDCIWRRRNENKRRWLKFSGGRRRNSTELNNDDRNMHPFIHTAIWQEKHNGPIHGGDHSDAETRLDRYRHHRHHHHHHHNRTTTTPPPTTTTTPSAQLSGMEEMVLKRHLISHLTDRSDDIMTEP